MGHERWFRGQHDGHARPFDWLTAARQHGIPDKLARTLHDQAMQQAHGSTQSRVQEISLALLADARRDASRPSPGKVTRTMRLQAERAGKRRPRSNISRLTGQPIAPCKSPLTSYIGPAHGRTHRQHDESPIREELAHLVPNRAFSEEPEETRIDETMRLYEASLAVVLGDLDAFDAQDRTLLTDEYGINVDAPRPDEADEDGAAQRLPEATRARMERAFGQRFDDVIVHPDSPEVAGEMHAFTRSHELHFRAGAFAPGTRRGDHIIAHELAHIVQQSGAQQPSAPRREGRSTAALEADADRAATQAVLGQQATVQFRSHFGQVQAYRDAQPGNAEQPDEEQDEATAPLEDPDAKPAASGERPVATSGPGKPMPAAVQAKMEDAFSFDFSAVRIHEGSEAQSVGAVAYTQGADIHFAPGHYDPNSQHGQRLLGHELAHVVQQVQGRVRPTTQTEHVAINDEPSLEREADELGARSARHEPLPEPVHSDPPGGLASGRTTVRPSGTSGPARGSVIQLTRVKTKKHGEIDTQTETDIKKLRYLVNRKTSKGILDQGKTMDHVREEAEARIRFLDPLCGFQQAVPKQQPNKKSRVPLQPGAGANWRDRPIPPKYAPHGSKEGPIQRIKKLESWEKKPLQLEFVDEFVEKEKRRVPVIVCPYTQEWIRVEEADLDHVIPVAKLREHLHLIAKRMTNEPSYFKQVQFSLEDKGLALKDWFIQEGEEEDGEAESRPWKPTLWAMSELYNNPANLVFSSKYANQTGKGDKDTKSLIEENPWFGERFFEKYTLLTANIGLSDSSGMGVGACIEQHSQEEHAWLHQQQLAVFRAERRMALRGKQIELGQGQNGSRKNHERKSTAISAVAEQSTDSEGEDPEDRQTQILRVTRRLVVDNNISMGALYPEAVKEQKQSAKKQKRRIKRLKTQVKDKDAELAKLRAMLAKSTAELAKLRKSEELERQEPKVKDQPDREQKRRKPTKKRERPEDFEDEELAEPAAKRAKFGKDPSSLLESLDSLNQEKKGTSKDRINSLKNDKYLSPESFRDAYVGRALLQWKERLANKPFKKYKENNQKWWGKLTDLLDRYYRARQDDGEA